MELLQSVHQSYLECHKEVFLDHYCSLTFLTVSHRAQQPDYLQMTLSCIVTSRQRKMHLYCNRTQTNYSNGRVTGKWSSTSRSARLSMSPTKGSSSIKLTKFTTTLWKKLTLQKILGVNIHKALSWNHHINSITNKANSIRAFLQRNIHYCPGKTKELCYKTLVRPIVEYSSVTWDPRQLATLKNYKWCSDAMHALCLETTEQQVV